MSVHYTPSHEWIAIDGDRATVGITDHAQSLLGDLVFVQLPQVGARVAKGESIAVVESVKSVAEVYAPMSGTITEVNAAAAADPAIVNTAPMAAGWLFKLQLSAPAEAATLLSADEYERLGHE
jgi:glycine cleavage system H protein